MSGYFETLIRAVEAAGLHRPALVVDHERLNRNLDKLGRLWPAPEALRLADKSIPVPALLERGFEAFGSTRVMSFHLPLTEQVLARFPETEVLMGKPMPVAAAADFVAGSPHEGRVTWLIDSMERLAAYRALAAEAGVPLRVAFEVNVGLGRGGFERPELLARALQDVAPLKVCGVMGYEAHIHALPKILGGGARAQERAMAQLAAFAEVLGPDQREIINTAGSSTLLGLPHDGAANDFTVGSLMLKPSDFDQEINGEIEPAFFIVTPVLKTYNHQLPGHPKLTRVLQKMGLIREQIAFGYGGKWMAQPVYPEGLTGSPFFAPSSNQHGLCLKNGNAEPSHFVFRPTQSEAVLQQFGSIHVFEDARIIGEWQPFKIC